MTGFEAASSMGGGKGGCCYEVCARGFDGPELELVSTGKEVKAKEGRVL